MTIHQDIGSETAMLDELARLRAENESLKAQAASGIKLKVSERGALSIYGMGRFPVTLYKSQWLTVLGVADVIRAFIRDNDAQLKDKE